jgi:hypothetical protein
MILVNANLEDNMEKLHFIKHSVATSETGPFNPQIEKIFPQLNYEDPESIYRLFDDFNDFPKVSPKIDFAVLRKGARLTDLLSSSALVVTGFLVNEKFKEVLIQLRLPEYKLYRVPVKSDAVLFDYYWFHLLQSYMDSSFDEIQLRNVAFDQSEFFLEKHLMKVSDVRLSSVEELNTRRGELGVGKNIKAGKLVLDKKFLTRMPDLFKIPLLGTHWIIREAARKLILENKVSGVDMLPIQNVYFK